MMKDNIYELTNNKSSEFHVWLCEYKRPWKLLSLLIGNIMLIFGSFYYQAPDWDIPISFIMAIFTYLTAPWSLTVILKRQWKRFPIMLFFTWFSVDGCYWLYWHFKNPIALEMMRSANFLASLTLYGTCGLIWLYQGSLREMFLDIKNLLRKK